MTKPPTVFLGRDDQPRGRGVPARAPDRHRADRLDRAARPARAAPDRRPRPDRGRPPRRAARSAPSSRPSINYALSYPHVGFTGVVHLRIPTFMALIEDLCASLASIGFRRIVFLNGHYDNTYAIAYACANAADRLPAGTRAFPVNYWDGMTAEEAGEFFGPIDRAAREPRRDLGRAGDQPGPRGHGRGQRGDAAVPRGHEPGAGPHGVLLLGAGLGPPRDALGHVGRRARVDAPSTASATSRS